MRKVIISKWTMMVVFVMSISTTKSTNKNNDLHINTRQTQQITTENTHINTTKKESNNTYLEFDESVSNLTSTYEKNKNISESLDQSNNSNNNTSDDINKQFTSDKNGTKESSFQHSKQEDIKYDENIASTVKIKKFESKENEEDGVELEENGPEQREIDEAVEYGLKAMKELIEVKEPYWYKLGLYLDKNEPASYVAAFSAPNEKTLKLTQYGYAALEASRKLTEMYPDSLARQRTGLPATFKADSLSNQCPLGGNPRCSEASRRYRTADGTCNNFEFPWRGSSLLPMQRFLPPSFDDGVQSIRRSVFGGRLPSAREISVRIHQDRNHEMPSVTMMFMQWGQFLDHDLIQSAQARSFNNSVPRCCDRGGADFLPPDLLHPSCLPIEVPNDDWFLSQFGVRCIEFIRSAPTSRINCHLGWREQINQVTPYIDASTVYGSDIRTADSIRLFRSGLLQYGRPRNQGPLRPPDPPGGELCRAGAITTDCFNSGDGRTNEQPGLTAFHTTWLRYHNKLAARLQKLNQHWSDEKIYQETRKIIGALIQHISYREFLPLVLGHEVMELFELNLLRKGYYNGYDHRINPAIANSFGTAAFRFGHSLVQNSYIRTDSKHRPIFNNVTLHREQENVENIWSFGSIDRLLLGFCNQPSQKRDEFISDELTNHLFQSNSPFGMDLASINIQRGRDHGNPPYTAWREPCGLSSVRNWEDLQRIMPVESANRFRSLYAHVDDIDLFSAGLAEYPVRGGIVGPTFACIIAQQFLNLRKGDRFWYENGNFDSSFTPAQLQQIRKLTFAQVICQTMSEVETIQPFVFLTADNLRNVRLPCNSPLLENLDLNAWTENKVNEVDSNEFQKKVDNGSSDEINVNVDSITPKEGRARKKTKRRKTTTTTTTKRPYVRTTKRPTDLPLRIKITNVTTTTIDVENKYQNSAQTITLTNIPQRPQYDMYKPQDYNYLYPVTTSRNKIQTTSTIKPLELNIQIQYFLPNTQTSTTERPYVTTNRRKVTTKSSRPNYQTTKIPYTSQQTTRPYIYRPQYSNFYENQFENKPFSTSSSRPNIYPNYYVFSDDYFVTTKRPYNRPIYNDPQTTKYPSYLYLNNDDEYDYVRPYKQRPQQHGYSYNNNKNDPIRQVYSEAINSGQFSDNIPSKPTFGHSSYDVEKLFRDKINKLQSSGGFTDRLDFKSDLVTPNKKFGLPDVVSDSNDKNFVKISSIRGDALMNRRRNKNDSPEHKEGDLELEMRNFHSNDRKVRIVRIDVTPREVRENQWIYYNATDEEAPLPFVPDVTHDISFSNEIPHPINITLQRNNKNNKTDSAGSKENIFSKQTTINTNTEHDLHKNKTMTNITDTT